MSFEDRPAAGRAASVACACLLLVAGTARAGPPLVTDDPVPTERTYWEIVTPVTWASVADEREIGMPGLDLNYGGGRNLQLTMGAGILWDEPSSQTRRWHWDGVEMAAKIRFLNTGRENRRTQLAVFPRVLIPPSSRWGDLRWERVDYQWPLVWLQELDQRTRLYGDLHVTAVHDAERNPVFEGIAFERDLDDHWMLTGEVFREGAEDRDAAATSAFQLGVVRSLARSSRDDEAGIDLLFAAGRTFASAPNLLVYVGPRFTFRSLR